MSYEYEDWTRDVIDHVTTRLDIGLLVTFGTKHVSLAVFKILASKRIGVKTLTFQGHET